MLDNKKIFSITICDFSDIYLNSIFAGRVGAAETWYKTGNQLRAPPNWMHSCI